MRKSFTKSFLRLHLFQCEQIEFHHMNGSALIYAREDLMDKAQICSACDSRMRPFGASQNAFVGEGELNAKIQLPSYILL